MRKVRWGYNILVFLSFHLSRHRIRQSLLGVKLWRPPKQLWPQPPLPALEPAPALPGFDLFPLPKNVALFQTFKSKKHIMNHDHFYLRQHVAPWVSPARQLILRSYLLLVPGGWLTSPSTPAPQLLSSKHETRSNSCNEKSDTSKAATWRLPERTAPREPLKRHRANLRGSCPSQWVLVGSMTLSIAFSWGYSELAA